MIRYSLFILVLSLLSFPLRAAQLTSSEVLPDLPELNQAQEAEFLQAVQQCNPAEEIVKEVKDFTEHFHIEPFELSDEDGNMLFDIVEDAEVAEILIRAFIKRYDKLKTKSDIKGNTILHYILGLKCIDIDLKKKLVESLPENFDVNQVNNRGKTGLHVTLDIPSSNSQMELLVSSFIRKYGPQSVGVPVDVSRIILAFYPSKKLQILIALKNRGANPNQVNEFGTPQFWAAYNGDGQLLKWLIEIIGANPMQGGGEPGAFDQNAPLHAAVGGGFLDIVKYLIEQAGVHPDQKSDEGKTAVYFAVLQRDKEILEYLVEKASANPNLEDKSGFKPIHIAARKGYKDILRLLVKSGKVDWKKEISKGHFTGVSVFDLAVANRHLNVWQYLIEQAELNVDQKNDKVKEALFSAVLLGHQEILEYLVEKAKADLGQKSENGLNLIHTATTLGYENILRYLVESGKVDWKEKVSEGPRYYIGMSVVHLAALMGHLNICQYLIEELKMPVDEVVERGGGYFQGKKAIDIAREKRKDLNTGHTDVISYLEQKGKQKMAELPQ